MKPKTAVWLDIWLGRTLCVIVTSISRISRIFKSYKKSHRPPDKILFLELSEMGAAILAYSAMLEARKRYPKAELYFWVFKDNAESIHILNIIPSVNVIMARTDNLAVFILDILRNLVRIRKEKIDTIIDMELFSRFTSILTYLAGASVKVGFHKFTMEGLDRADIYTHKVAYNPHSHISKNFLALVRSLEGESAMGHICDFETVVPMVKSSENDLNSVWTLLRNINSQISFSDRIVIINPGIGEYLYLRRWPLENYVEFANRVFEDEDAFVVAIGLKSESAKLTGMEDLLDSSRFINLIGMTTIKDVIALCNIASLVVSHDSGAVNLASLTPVPVVVLFGPETPLLYASLNRNKKVLYKGLSCSPCFSAYNHRSSSCRDNICLKTITVDEVCEAAEELGFTFKRAVRNISSKRSSCASTTSLRTPPPIAAG